MTAFRKMGVLGILRGYEWQAGRHTVVQPQENLTNESKYDGETTSQTEESQPRQASGKRKGSQSKTQKAANLEIWLPIQA